MVTTLRMTSVLAFLLAVGLSAFGLVHGIEPNPAVGALLDQPAVVDQFKAEEGQRNTVKKDQISPLVAQAKRFKDYLDPLLPAQQAKRPPGQSGTRKPPVPTFQPKFQVLSTSYHPTNPLLSRALIDEPGAGTRWVRIDDQIGPHNVVAIKDGALVMNDGQEVPVPVVFRPSLVVQEGPEAAAAASIPHPPKPAMAAVVQDTQPAQVTSVPAGSALPSKAASSTLHQFPSVPANQPELSEQDEQSMNEIINQMRDIKKTGGTLSEADEKKRRELMENLTRRLRSRDINRRDPNAGGASR
ncbi:hypothetical protein ACFL6U_26110 [Planctomycetota bacterium]